MSHRLLQLLSHEALAGHMAVSKIVSEVASAEVHTLHLNVHAAHTMVPFKGWLV